MCCVKISFFLTSCERCMANMARIWRWLHWNVHSCVLHLYLSTLLELQFKLSVWKKREKGDNVANNQGMHVHGPFGGRAWCPCIPAWREQALWVFLPQSTSSHSKIVELVNQPGWEGHVVTWWCHMLKRH